MAQLFVGCPMWANRSWVGRYLPRNTVPGTELGPYSQLLNAVEGNTTFYAVPPALAVHKWATLAAPGFRMVFKAPRALTHDRRLRDVSGELAAFADLLAPLGDRLGGITLQLPASFAPSDLPALADTVSRLPGHVRWSVEVRHPQFCGGQSLAALHRLLEQHGMERVVLDTTALFAHPPTSAAGRDEWKSKPRLPIITSALTDHPIVRFVGGDHAGRTASGLARWEDTLATWLAEGRSPTCFLHTPDNRSTPELARALHDHVRHLVPAIEPLPEPPPILPAEQGSLF